MEQTFTPELLLQHLYHETDSITAGMISHAMEKDQALRETYAELAEAKALLDEGGSELPSGKVLLAIQQYSLQHEEVSS